MIYLTSSQYSRRNGIYPTRRYENISDEQLQSDELKRLRMSQLEKFLSKYEIGEDGRWRKKGG